MNVLFFRFFFSMKMKSSSDTGSPWLHDDSEKDYKKSISLSFGETVWKCVNDGIDKGMDVGGGILGIPGVLVGCLVGALQVRLRACMLLLQDDKQKYYKSTMLTK